MLFYDQGEVLIKLFLIYYVCTGYSQVLTDLYPSLIVSKYGQISDYSATTPCEKSLEAQFKKI